MVWSVQIPNMIGLASSVTRNVLAVDGYTLLELDKYTQSAITIDLTHGKSQVDL